MKKGIFLKISKVSMLINFSPHLTHALSSMYEWNAILHEKGEREGKFSPQGGGSGGGLIGQAFLPNLDTVNFHEIHLLFSLSY